MEVILKIMRRESVVEKHIKKELQEKIYNSKKLMKLVLFDLYYYCYDETKFDNLDWDSVFFFFIGGSNVHRYGDIDYKQSQSVKEFKNYDEFKVYLAEFSDFLDDRNHNVSDLTCRFVCIKKHPGWKQRKFGY